MAHPDPPGSRPAGSSYTPTLPAAEAERIRQWHQRAYEAARTEAGSGRTFSYLGRTLVVPPGVQPITGMSHLLGEAVLNEVRPDDRVLDMGTGCGVNAILAASTAGRVLAVDVSPIAVRTARDNAERNNVADRMETRHSDVFSHVDGRFDLIVFDPPFRWFAPRDLFEAATTDENYRAMTTFFRDAGRYLTPGGRMLIFFGTSGDLAYLKQLTDEAGFTRQTVAHQDLVKDGWRVDYFTFRLTRTAAAARPRPPA
ncbi:methyltransferase domain-containing protein [Nonomuraea sp. MG754425]|uniref:methyltransferase n=1 Tax=Nonomuraea sp. MG754425 TaxID=2570319 RepID=UPI001EFF6298|nr:methyltransferase [Nonomuraea sp. MG754425]MCF6474071.1 methyltransferase domain-containing protein [Nonomuraea sp. MG754425]